MTKLEQRTAELEEQLRKKNEELQATQSLRGEVESLRAANSQMEDRLRQQSEAIEKSQAENMQLVQNQHARSASNEWKTRYEDLRQVTDQVRQESAQTLQELTVLSQQHDQTENEREELLTRVSQLEKEVADWRTKFTKTRSQLRTLKATSMSLRADHPDATQLARDRSFTDPKGLVKDIHVTNYQTAIDELLHLARTDKPSTVFDYMRVMVSAVRAVVGDMDSASPSDSEETVKERGKLKKRVSNAANNLMTTARTFAKSEGLSPVSLIDAAASNLTAAVIDLIKVAKISPTPAGELQVDSDGRLESLQVSPIMSHTGPRTVRAFS